MRSSRRSQSLVLPTNNHHTSSPSNRLPDTKNNSPKRSVTFQHENDHDSSDAEENISRKRNAPVSNMTPKRINNNNNNNDSQMSISTSAIAKNRFPLLSTAVTAMKIKNDDNYDDDDAAAGSHLARNILPNNSNNSDTSATVPPPTTTASSEDQEYVEVQDDTNETSPSLFFPSSSSVLHYHSELSLMPLVKSKKENGVRVHVAEQLVEKNHVVAAEEEEISQGRLEHILNRWNEGMRNSVSNQKCAPLISNFVRPFTSIVVRSLLECPEDVLEGLITRRGFRFSDEGNSIRNVQHLKSYLRQRQIEMESRRMPRKRSQKQIDDSAERESSEETSTSSSTTSDSDDQELNQDNAASPKSNNYSKNLANVKTNHHRSCEDKDFFPNCVCVALHTGNPAVSSMETMRVIISACRISEKENFIVHPSSVFRCFDEESWVAGGDRQNAEKIDLTPAIVEILIGNTRTLPSALSLTVPLSRHWPRKFYHHGIGRRYKQQVDQTKSQNNIYPQVPFPLRLLELQPCEALGGELELVAGTDLGVPSGTAFIYGGILAEPKKKAISRLLASSSSSSSSSKSNKVSSPKQQQEQQQQIPSSIQLESVDTENFVYCYDAGEDKMVLGNSLPRYINHKMNFAPSGNVQFVNVTLNRKSTWFKDENNNNNSNDVDEKSQSLNSNDAVDEDDDEAEEGIIESGSRRRRPRTVSSVSKKSQKKGGKIFVKSSSTNNNNNNAVTYVTTSTIVIPIFLVVSDLTHKHQVLLADSYGAPYDSEMDRYVACSNEPLSAIDVNKIRRKLSASSIPSGENLPTVTCGYSAAYRTAIEAGSFVAKVDLLLAPTSEPKINLYYVHAASWGDARAFPRNLFAKTLNDDDGMFNEIDDDDDQQNEMSELLTSHRNQFVEDNEDDADGETFVEQLHRLRLRRYFDRVTTTASESLALRRSCPSNSKFLLVEPLDEISFPSQSSSPRTSVELASSEIVENTIVQLTESGCKMYNISDTDKNTESKMKFFFRRSAPAKLQKPSKTATTNSIPVCPSLTNLLSSSSSSSSLAKKRNVSSEENVIPMELLDANDCILCIPYRDGLWPIEVDVKAAEDSSNNNNSNNKTKSSPKHNTKAKSAVATFEANVLTSVERMVASKSLLYSAEATNDTLNQQQDAKMFTTLRKMELMNGN